MSTINSRDKYDKPFDRANRTYYVSDERLRAFRELTTEEKLRWVEELASFLRMALPICPLVAPQDLTLINEAPDLNQKDRPA